jgi:endonuclease/exonuclease/phosphatase (EEP) superfamily protein YafD
MDLRRGVSLPALLLLAVVFAGGGGVAFAAGQSGTGTELGEVGTITAKPGAPVSGKIRIVNANLPYPSGTVASLRAIENRAHPDFITLNEIHDFTPAELSGALPGYGAYKDPVMLQGHSPAQSINNAIMWRSDRWQLVDGGRVKIVDDDRVVFHHHRARFDRFAVWGVFKRIKDGAVVSVVATHQMVNPNRWRQWGDQPFTRQEQYGEGMSYIAQLGAELFAYGPVLIGGDMNSHPTDGIWSAAPRLTDAGYSYTKDSGVMYQFFPKSVTVAEHSEMRVRSDHPANITVLSMNDATALD